ncbi:restriction endonuclease subunit S [Streptococcus sp. sy004]|uniref:restriction endonuclease subunit S n=1 Tax=Streptococcus sp. sy004 TaxID=2600149 RepID=UPI0011B78A12|nr:restriction endonuclease subunit S [Streptococcus sp. sy004]TWT12253.1 hypothetical protein FRX54_01635 [Streptococcus sp. sy004]
MSGGGGTYSLENISLEIFAGGDAPKDFSKEKTLIYQYPIYSNGVGVNALYGFSKTAKVKQKPAITVSARGTLGHVMYLEEKFTPIVRLITIIPNENMVKGKYLKYVLSNTSLENTGGLTPQLTVPNIKKIKIQLPSIDKQEQIITKIENLESLIKIEEDFLNTIQQQKESVVSNYLNPS